MAAVRVHVRIAGRVQGVGFRYAAAAEARRAGVAGWVRNLEAGEVEAVFEGPPEAIQALVRWCHQGPPGAHVRQVRALHEPVEGLTAFEIRATSFGAA